MLGAQRAGTGASVRAVTRFTAGALRVREGLIPIRLSSVLVSGFWLARDVCWNVDWVDRGGRTWGGIDYGFIALAMVAWGGGQVCGRGPDAGGPLGRISWFQEKGAPVGRPWSRRFGAPWLEQAPLCECYRRLVIHHSQPDKGGHHRCAPEKAPDRIGYHDGREDDGEERFESMFANPEVQWFNSRSVSHPYSLLRRRRCQGFIFLSVNFFVDIRAPLWFMAPYR